MLHRRAGQVAVGAGLSRPKGRGHYRSRNLGAVQPLGDHKGRPYDLAMQFNGLGFVPSEGGHDDP